MKTTYIQCSGCGELSQAPVRTCKCGKIINNYRDISQLGIHMFPDELFEHIAAEPLKIRGRKHLNDECSARGLTSHYTNPAPTMKELRASGHLEGKRANKWN